MLKKIINSIKSSFATVCSKRQLYEANKELAKCNCTMYEQIAKLEEENAKLEDELQEHKKEITKLIFENKGLKIINKELSKTKLESE